MRPIAVAIGAVIVLAAPFTLIDPDGFYNSLVKPSLVALWLSQLIVFAVYPLFARKHGQRMLAGVDAQPDRERVRDLRAGQHASAGFELSGCARKVHRRASVIASELMRRFWLLPVTVFAIALLAAPVQAVVRHRPAHRAHRAPRGPTIGTRTRTPGGRLW